MNRFLLFGTSINKTHKHNSIYILLFIVKSDNSMSNPIVLVTGGSGLVGHAIQAIEALFDDKNMRFVYLSSKDCDLSSLHEVNLLFYVYHPTYVIHLAACVGGLYKNMNHKVDMLEKNLMINYNIVKCAHDYKVKRLIACLSTCIFPDQTTYPIDESMLHDGPPHSSNDAYAYAKRMLEIHCRAYHENYGDDFICVIPTNIYGPHDNFNLQDGHVLPALIQKCCLAKEQGIDFEVRGSGTPLRQFIYSEDLAALILRVLFDQSGTYYQNLILSTNEADEVSIKDVATKIAECFDYNDRLTWNSAYSDGQYKKTASNAQLCSIFSDVSFTPIDIGIQRTVQWFLDNRLTARL